MARPITFDITHLVSRLPVARPTGIDKVDLAYCAHLAGRPLAAVVHYGLARPRVHDPSILAGLAALATDSRWTGRPLAEDAAFWRLREVLTGQSASPPVRAATASFLPSSDSARRRAAHWRWRLAPGRLALPADAIYLNVAQHAFEFHRFFRWMRDRPDVLPVFLVHDLLPLDFPEYFRAGYRERFARRAATIADHARALIATTEAVRERLDRELDARGRPRVPVHVAPLPTTLAAGEPGDDPDPDLAGVPYFVVLGTIEPRKNHLLLLEVWRRLAARGQPPKLVVVGSRGWENEQVVDMLDRSAALAGHVIECSGLSDRGLRRLLGHARALLMPSFAEGYGLPVVEALSLGTPVVASDIPVFHEVAQERALFRHTLDGLGWLEAVEQLSRPHSDLAREARALAAAYRAPTWTGYFAGIEAFLASL